MPQRNRTGLRLTGFCYGPEVLEIAHRIIKDPGSANEFDPYSLSLAEVREMGWSKRLLADRGLFIVKAVYGLELKTTTSTIFNSSGLSQHPASPRERVTALQLSGELQLVDPFIRICGESADPVSKNVTVSPTHKFEGGYKFITDFTYTS